MDTTKDCVVKEQNMILDSVYRAGGYNGNIYTGVQGITNGVGL